MSSNQQPSVAWLVNAKQAAEILKVNVSSVWKLTSAGYLKPSRIPGVGTRYWISDLIELAERHTERVQLASKAAELQEQINQTTSTRKQHGGPTAACSTVLTSIYS